MPKLPLILRVAAALVLIAALAWLFSRVVEPGYHGKSLRAWLNEADQNGDMQALYDGDGYPDTATANAVRAIGSDGVRTLVRMLRAKDPPPGSPPDLGIRLAIYVQRWLPWFPRNASSAEERHERASYAFRLIGPAAQSALPDLIPLLRDDDASVQVHAAYCLGALGPAGAPAVPALQQYLKTLLTGPITNRVSEQSEEIYYALRALGEIGPLARAAVPQIAALTNDPTAPRRHGRAEAALIKITGTGLDSALQPLQNPMDYTNWLIAVTVVREMGSNAAPAVPMLIASLQHTNATNSEMLNLALEGLARAHAHPELSIPAVTPFLQSSDSGNRWWALRVVSVFAADAKPWAPTSQITHCLADPDFAVCQTASNTLRRLAESHPANPR